MTPKDKPAGKVKCFKIYCPKCGEERDILEDIEVLFPSISFTCVECKTKWEIRGFWESSK